MTRAHDHPAYDDAIQQAVRLAAHGTEAAVYAEDGKLFVCAVTARPATASTLCIAQKWDERTVQLRFAGAMSEWVKI